MTDSEGEIEYLDEDADIIQQFVQNTMKREDQDEYQNTTRKSSQNKSKWTSKDDDDTDYSPSEENVRPSKRKRPQRSQSKPVQNSIDILPSKKIKDEKSPPPDIKIPDYEDPLCMPVKMGQRDRFDTIRLKNWNNLCLEHMKTVSTPLKAECSGTVRSRRTVVLRNVKSINSAKTETTVWSKTLVEGGDGDRSSEVFQCVLPKYRESKALHYQCSDRRKLSDESSLTRGTVVLNKEMQSQEEVLVTYQVEDATITVFKMQEDSGVPGGAARSVCLQQWARVRACAACHHAARRQAPTKHTNKNITCAVCGRYSVSIYNYLQHLNTHDSSDVLHQQRKISHTLAELVPYHYWCRACLRRLPSIRALRRHLARHTCKEAFTCEIGNHFVKPARAY